MHCIKHTAPRNFFVPGSSRVTLPPIQRDKEHLCKAPIQSLTPATGDVWHMTYPEPGMTHMPFTWGLHDTSWYFIKPELQLPESRTDSMNLKTSSVAPHLGRGPRNASPALHQSAVQRACCQTVPRHGRAIESSVTNPETTDSTSCLKETNVQNIKKSGNRLSERPPLILCT